MEKLILDGTVEPFTVFGFRDGLTLICRGALNIGARPDSVVGLRVGGEFVYLPRDVVGKPYPVRVQIGDASADIWAKSIYRRRDGDIVALVCLPGDFDAILTVLDASVYGIRPVDGVATANE